MPIAKFSNRGTWVHFCWNFSFYTDRRLIMYIREYQYPREVFISKNLTGLVGSIQRGKQEWSVVVYKLGLSVASERSTSCLSSLFFTSLVIVHLSLFAIYVVLILLLINLYYLPSLPSDSSTDASSLLFCLHLLIDLSYITFTASVDRCHLV